MIIFKKFSVRILTLSALVLTIGSCAENTEKAKEAKETPEVLAPAQIVQIDQAKEMYENYSDRRLPLIQKYEDSINEGKKKFDVARYVSYDYKTIKLYIAFIEQEAKNANVEISGLRLYFSNYPDKPFFDNRDSILHPRQNSVMLSPTVKKGDRDYLFYIGGTQAKQEVVLLSDSFGALKTQETGGTDSEAKKAHASMLPKLNISNTNTTLNTSFYSGTSLTMNRGHGVPPPHHEN